MAIVEAISIPIGVTGQDTVTKAANAYEDLGDAVAKTQLEAEKLANTFGINDQRTQEAIKVAGKYKQQMEQLDAAVDGARGGVARLTQTTQAVVAGFEVAAGAAGLFGGESEELQKALLKVQSAMALSQGIADLKQYGGSIKSLATNVSGTLVKAFQGFSAAAKSAIAATGIGLLVVAVGTIVSYWDDIMEAVSGVDSEQKRLLDTQSKLATTSEEQLNSISEQENILKQQGKTEEDILNLKIAATKTTITALEAQLITQKEIKKSQIEASQRNKAILQGIIQFISLPLTGLLMTVDAVGKALGQDFGLNEKFAGGLASLVFDPESVAEEADKTIAETEANLGKLRNSLAGNENAVKAIRTQSAKDNKAAADKAAADATAAAEKEFQDWLAIEVEKAETAQANRDFQKSREEKEAAEAKAAAEKEFEEWLAIEVEKAETAQANADFQKAREEKEAADKTAREDKQAEEDKARMQAVADLEQEIFNNSQALAQALINIVGQNTKAGKALALASIAADTARALSGALANSQAPTPDNVATGGLAGIAKYIALATTILTNSKRAYDIIKAPSPSISPSGGGGAAAAVPRFNAPGVRMGTNEEFTQATRIYVTERDISNVQNKVRVTEGLSQF
jgi:flagellar biosynthesis GTPase FlhF